VTYDEALADRIRALLRTRRDVGEKRMFGGVAFMIHGHMGCGVLGSRLIVRVDPSDGERLLQTPHVSPMDFTGRPMRGFVFVNPPGIATAAGLRAWIRRATGWVDAQPRKPPKPTQPPKTPGTRQAAASARPRTGTSGGGRARG
jgi:hypothetical protein